MNTTTTNEEEEGTKHQPETPSVPNDDNNDPQDLSLEVREATNMEMGNHNHNTTATTTTNNNTIIATTTTTTPNRQSYWPSIPTPVRRIGALSLPIIVSEIFQNTLPIVDLAFVGRLLSEEDLAAAALATVWFNLWNATMLGFCTAIDTLLSQAMGAKHYAMVGAWTGLALWTVMGMTCLMAGLVAVCGPVMKLLGQDEALSQEAGQFSYRLIPGLFPYFAFKVLVKYLQTQDILWPGVAIGILANLFNIAVNWLLISAWGLHGAPIATSLTRCLEFLAMLGYFYFHRHSQVLAPTWPTLAPARQRRLLLLQPSLHEEEGEEEQEAGEATDDDTNGTSTSRPPPFKVFWKLAASGALSFTAEAWSFEITTLLAGLLGTTELDAHIITLSIATFLYLSFPFAIGVAASIQVGQWIGAGRPDEAQRSSRAAYLLTFVIQATLIILVLPSSRWLGDLFSSSPEVSNLVAKLLPLSCVFMMGDSFQSTTGGILRGLGRQRLVLGLNIIGFWVLAVPVGALLTFVADIGVYGLWWGMSVGIYSSSALGLILLKYAIDWPQETLKAKNRMSSTVGVGEEVVVLEALDHGDSTME